MAMLMDRPLAGLYHGLYFAKVIDVSDPESIGRVKVRLHSFDGPEDQDGPLWADVAAPFAGPDRGAFFLPDVDDEVVVAFINGDQRRPVVVGSLWHGGAAPPEQIGNKVDRWSIVGKEGTRIAIVEERAASATIALETPAGVTQIITDEGGGKVEIKAAGTTVTIDSSGVAVDTSATVKISATQVDVSAGMVNVSAGMSKFSGVVQCDTLITNSVVSASYTPGAGNVW